MHGGETRGGTSVPFQYSESALEACLSSRRGGEGSGGEDRRDGRALHPCHELYYQFLKHYRPDQAQLWDEEATKTKAVTDGDGHYSSSDARPGAPTAIVARLFPDSFDRFCDTLLLVHKHNGQSDGRSNLHVLRLNQFADQPSPFGRRGGEGQPRLWQTKVDEIWEARGHESTPSVDRDGGATAPREDVEGGGDGSSSVRQGQQRRRRLRRGDAESPAGLDFATLLDGPASILRRSSGSVSVGHRQQQEVTSALIVSIHRLHHLHIGF
jgi:hypothetical protein